MQLPSLPNIQQYLCSILAASLLSSGILSAATPRLLDPIPDGTPAPAPPPSKVVPFKPDPANILETRTIRQGGRTITYQRIDAPDLPPPPEPATPPTAEERSAFTARLAALRKNFPKRDFLLLGATVYLSENHPPRTFVREWPMGGGEPISLWTNLDFRQLGIGRFLGSDGTIHELVMMWSTIDTSRTAAAWAARGRTYRPPVFPDFPNENPAAAGRPAALVGPATYFIISDAPANPALIRTFADLLQVSNENRPALQAAFIRRENTRLAREADLKANPPQPQDAAVHYWLKTTAPILPPDTPGLPGATPATTPKRRRRPNKNGARRSHPNRRTGFQPVMENGLPASHFHLTLILLTAFTWLFLATPSRAILDTNQNTLSDIWELDTNNGTLIPHVDPANPAATADDDPDHDGWTNAMEAAAGTRHNDDQPPLGILRPELHDIPAVYQTINGVTSETSPRRLEIVWSGIIGKAYTLQDSLDLITWTSHESILCNGTPMSAGVNIEADDGDPLTPAQPSKQFIRLAVNDVDYPDGDGLTNYEEHVKGTNPSLADTDNDGKSDKEELEWTAPDGSHPLNPLDPDYDKDGILDGIEAALNSPTSPIINNAVESPDTAGFINPSTGLPGWFFTNLCSYWTFENTTTYNGKTYYPSHTNDPANNAEISFPKPSDPTGIISNAAVLPSIIGGFPKAPATALVPATSCTVSFWVRCSPGSIQAKTGRSTFFSLHNGTTTNPTLALTIQESDNATSGQILKAWRSDGQADLTALLPYGSYLDDGNWRHIALVRDGGVAGNPDLRIYIDGNLLNSAKTASSSPYTATSAGYFMIGGWSTALPAYGLSASLDRFSVHASALTAQQVAAIYNCDSEHDTLPDRLEITNPQWRDLNSDGTGDPGEMFYQLSPFIWNDPNDDTDQDGIPTLIELADGTDPGDPDTDGDLIPDGWEKSNGLSSKDPNDAVSAPLTSVTDCDSDGLSNLDEYRNGTNPRNSNTDGDAKTDKEEVNGPDNNPATDDGSDPTDATDNGIRRPADQLVTFNLGVGDRSGSHSEDYVLNVFRIDATTGAEQRKFTLRSGGFGQYTTTTRAFKKGETYTFQIEWLGTNNGTTPTGTYPLEGPDWDYHLVVEPQGTDTGGILIDSYDPAAKTIDPSSPLRDSQDIADSDDDDDNVHDFPNTMQTRRVAFIPLEIQAIVPTDPEWLQQLDQSDVALDDQNLRLKIRLPHIQSATQQAIEQLGLDHLHLTTSATRPVIYTRMRLFGPATTLHATPSAIELRVSIIPRALRLMELLPDLNSDEVWGERACLDYVSGPDSSYADSEAFINPVKSIPSRYRGYALNASGVSLRDTPFKSNPRKSFMQAAGVELLAIKIEGTNVTKDVMVMNQADVFYYSGHGVTDVGGYAGPGLYALGTSSDPIMASDLSPYWGRDLDCVVIAGCAVLNINNWVAIPAYAPPIIGPGVGYWPGKIMENVGPPFLLGYGSSAPTDAQNSTAIVTAFMSDFATDGDAFQAWRDANTNSNGRNAVALQRGVKYGYFLRSEILGIPMYDWTEKEKDGDWNP